ncbi:MAG: hypothetical protein ACR2QK_03825, partial [Acidimicrobiales bacterium]
MRSVLIAWIRGLGVRTVELIGREGELTEIESRLRTRRLVTLTGPGGIGKTSLAMEAVTALESNYELGAFVADLTRIDEPDGVSEAIAGQLGFSDFASLLNSPGDQPALVVFDNCEHVLDAAADAATRLLASCEMPRILATSRSPLDLPGESVLTLNPLAIPQVGTATGADSLRLFIARAGDHGAELGQADLMLGAEICRRLDGMPLALEIAAARLRSLSVAERLEELEARPHALARPRFRGRRNHRSVADMVGWSTDLLSERSGRFFNRLGVFSGPFTASMAHAVASDVGDDRPATIDLLDDLVAASLVAADTGGQVAWYRLLHPIRAVALDRLGADGETDAVRSRWVDHVVELVVGVISRNSEGWDADLLEELLALYGNIAAALRWTVANEDEAQPDRSLILLAVLWGVVHQSHTQEVKTIGEAVLDRWSDRDAPYWADGAATVATCRNLLGDAEGAIALATSALPHVARSPYAPASLRRVLAQAHRANGNRQESRDLFKAGAEAAERTEAGGLAMELWVDHAVLLAELGDPDAGSAVIDQVLAEADRRGAGINRAWAMVGRGVIQLVDAADEAVPTLEAALAESRRLAYLAGISASLRALAMARFELCRTDDAAAAVIELLDELQERGGLNDLRMGLEIAAQIAEAVDDPAWADLAATAAALPVTTVSTAVTSEIFARARPSGRVLSQREAFQLCRQTMSTIIDRLEPVRPGRPTEQAEPAEHQDIALLPTSGPDLDPTDANTLIRDGDVWLVSFGGSATTLRTSKGLADLAALLASPEREIAAVDLTAAGLVDNSRDELLDTTARRNYEDRIRELQGELERAEADNDLGTAERLSQELDQLVDQLASAVGL